MLSERLGEQTPPDQVRPSLVSLLAAGTSLSQYASESGQLFERALAVFRCRSKPAVALLVTSGELITFVDLLGLQIRAYFVSVMFGWCYYVYFTHAS